MTTSHVRRWVPVAAIALLAALLAGLSMSAPVHADARAAPFRAGAVDAGFSAGGFAGFTDPMVGLQFLDVAVQRSGRILAAAWGSHDLTVVAFTPDGALDTTFGNAGTGVVSVDVGDAGQDDFTFAVTLDAQDRILLSGAGGAVALDFALVRLSADGKAVQLNNHVHVGNAGADAWGYDLALQSDGTIVMAGTATVGGDDDVALVRFNGVTGAVIGAPVTHSFSAGNDNGVGVAVYPSGPNQDKIVIAGEAAAADRGIGLVQRNADGTPDTSFGSGAGQLVLQPTATADVGRGVAITSSGSVLVSGGAGIGDSDTVLAQLLPSGAPDPAFSGGALRVLARPGAEYSRNHPLAVQPDGKIVLGVEPANGADIGIYRLNRDGSSDQSFGTAGFALFDLTVSDDLNAITTDSQGRILVAGDTPEGGFVARVLGNGDADGDGVLDPADACPTVAAPTGNGCPASAPAPEAVLKGKKVLLDAVLAKKKSSARCPDRVTVSVRTKSKDGRLAVTKKLRSTTVATGCRVKGKVGLGARPKASAKVTVSVKGKKLVTKRLVAVRL